MNLCCCHWISPWPWYLLCLGLCLFYIGCNLCAIQSSDSYMWRSTCTCSVRPPCGWFCRFAVGVIEIISYLWFGVVVLLLPFVVLSTLQFILFWITVGLLGHTVRRMLTFCCASSVLLMLSCSELCQLHSIVLVRAGQTWEKNTLYSVVDKG